MEVLLHLVLWAGEKEGGRGEKEGGRGEKEGGREEGRRGEGRVEEGISSEQQLVVLTKYG